MIVFLAAILGGVKLPGKMKVKEMKRTFLKKSPGISGSGAGKIAKALLR